MPDLSVVVVSFNTRSILADCLDSLIDSSQDLDVEIIVVDNASTDGTQEHLRHQYPTVRLIENDRNLGFAGANNLGISSARAPIVLLLNSDAFINNQTLTACLQLLETRPEAGMVGVKILNVDGSIQAEDGQFPSLWSDVATSLGIERIRRRRSRVALEAVRDADWVHGACIFVRRAAIDDAGMLDETFFMYSEEVDWCHRFWQRGWQVVYAGNASVIHLGGSSSTGDDLNRRARLYRSRLGLRRRLGGSISSALLWSAMISGFGLRIPVQWLIRSIPGLGDRRHSPVDDWKLLRQIIAMDPLARWAATD